MNAPEMSELILWDSCSLPGARGAGITSKKAPCTRLRHRPAISMLPACSLGRRDLKKWERLRRACCHWVFGTPRTQGQGLRGPEAKKHPRMRLRPRPDISVLPACSPGPRDSEKWKRLRRVCRIGVCGLPGRLGGGLRGPEA